MLTKDMMQEIQDLKLQGCAPEYVVRKTNKGKPGRPRKNEIVLKES